jgi:hypothetical protein
LDDYQLTSAVSSQVFFSVSLNPPRSRAAEIAWVGGYACIE